MKKPKFMFIPICGEIEKIKTTKKDNIIHITKDTFYIQRKPPYKFSGLAFKNKKAAIEFLNKKPL